MAIPATRPNAAHRPSVINRFVKDTFPSFQPRNCLPSSGPSALAREAKASCKRPPWSWTAIMGIDAGDVERRHRAVQPLQTELAPLFLPAAPPPAPPPP